MTDEEFDDALDGLSPSKRRQILRLVGDDEEAPTTPRMHPLVLFGRGWLIVLALLFGMPFMAVGLFLVVTVILAPVGFLFMLIGVWPFVSLTRKWVKESTTIHPSR